MDDFTKTVARSYDASLESYVRRTTLHEEKTTLLKEFIQRLPDDAHVLDVACGPGLEAGFLVKKGITVTGIDVAKEVIQYAKTNVPAATFHVMDCHELAFPDGTFHGVLSLAGIVCLRKENVLHVLREMHRVLKISGTLLISAKGGEGEGWEFDARDQVKKYYAYYREEELEALLVSAGFVVQDIGSAPSDTKRTWINAFAKKES